VGVFFYRRKNLFLCPPMLLQKIRRIGGKAITSPETAVQAFSRILGWIFFSDEQFFPHPCFRPSPISFFFSDFPPVISLYFQGEGMFKVLPPSLLFKEPACSPGFPLCLNLYYGGFPFPPSISFRTSLSRTSPLS